MARVKQEKLIDTDHPATAEIMRQAEAYRDLRDARMAALKPEIEAREALVASMQKHGLKVFEHDGLKVEVIAGKNKVRVRFLKDNEDGEPDEE